MSNLLQVLQWGLDHSHLMGAQQLLSFRIMMVNIATTLISCHYFSANYIISALTIGFESITYQVSEAMGVIEVCFEVEENNVLEVTGQAILITLSGSADGILL